MNSLDVIDVSCRQTLCCFYLTLTNLSPRKVVRILTCTVCPVDWSTIECFEVT